MPFITSVDTAGAPNVLCVSLFRLETKSKRMRIVTGSWLRILHGTLEEETLPYLKWFLTLMMLRQSSGYTQPEYFLRGPSHKWYSSAGTFREVQQAFCCFGTLICLTSALPDAVGCSFGNLWRGWQDYVEYN